MIFKRKKSEEEITELENYLATTDLMVNLGIIYRCQNLGENLTGNMKFVSLKILPLKFLINSKDKMYLYIGEI